MRSIGGEEEQEMRNRRNGTRGEKQKGFLVKIIPFFPFTEQYRIKINHKETLSQKENTTNRVKQNQTDKKQNTYVPQKT